MSPTNPPQLIRLAFVERRWNSAPPLHAQNWAAPAPLNIDKPYGGLAQEMRHALASRRRLLLEPKHAAADKPLAAASGQLLEWRGRAIAKLAATATQP
jgi:hypothetical protein